MSYQRGDIVWADDPFKDDPDAGRPFLVVSNDRHPFADEQVAVVALTTTPREEGVRLRDDAVTVGGLPSESYVSPWLLFTRAYPRIDRRLARVEPDFVDAIIDELLQYLR